MDTPKNQLEAQIDLHKKIRSGDSGLDQFHLPKELVIEKLLEGFKLGLLAAILGAATGGLAGSVIDAPELLAGHGASLGLLGGTIKGQTDVDKRIALSQGYKAQFPNIFKYLIGNPTITYPLAALSPDSGHIILRKL